MAARSDQPDILLLSESEGMAALDRRALRDAGAGQVHVMTSGIQAARLLAGLIPGPKKFRPDMVVCSQKMADMEGEQFCAVIRLHPDLMAFPVLLLLPNDGEMEQLKTLGCGASALLARPYSITDMKTRLEDLAPTRQRTEQMEKAARLTDTKAFDAALATYGILLKPVRSPEDYFRVGMQCLQEKRWNTALNAFQRALRNAQIKGEAELGMAVAWKGKGDIPRYKTFLALAAATFVRARRWHRARSVYARLLQEDPSAKSPFLAEARLLMRSSMYDDAADVLAEGFDLTSGKQIREKMAQTCLAAPNPNEMLRALENGLGRVLGDRGSRTGEDIHQHFELLVRDQETRRRQASEERRRAVSQMLERQKEAEAESAEAQPTAARIEPFTSPATAGPGTAASHAPLLSTFPAGRPRTNEITGMSVSDGESRSSTPGFLDDEAHADRMAWHTDSASDNKSDNIQADSKNTAPMPVLEPLSETDATSTLFVNRLGINEFLSVMKCTWKLAGRDKT